MKQDGVLIVMKQDGVLFELYQTWLSEGMSSEGML